MDTKRIEYLIIDAVSREVYARKVAIPDTYIIYMEIRFIPSYSAFFAQLESALYDSF